MTVFLPSTPVSSPPFAMDGPDPSLVSPSTSTTSSWSMDTDPQLFTPDATFWHDMSSYICPSPKSQYDQCCDDASATLEGVIVKGPPRGSRRVPSKDQSPEVILVQTPQTARDLSLFDHEQSGQRYNIKHRRITTLTVEQRRRAQNRASQRAYRDRKDRRVKELEAELKEIGKQNERLRRDHAELCTAHEKLKGEQIRWTEGEQALENDDAQFWLTETRLSPMLGENAKDLIERGLLIKVMICKR